VPHRTSSSITAEIKSPASRLPPIPPIGWRAAGFGDLIAEIFWEEFKNYYFLLAGGGARAPRSRFRHHRTASQAVHVNRDSGQLMSMGTGMTK
jgi:hypothetical protein